MSSRNKTIDILRFITVFFVAGFTHLLSYADIRVTSIHPALGYAVKIMMVSLVYVSGYLNGKKEFNGKYSILSYYKKRLINTYIPFLISAVLSYGVYLFTDEWLFKDMKSFVLSIFALSAVFIPLPATLWFLIMMLVLYLITPFLLYKRKSSSIIIKAVIIYAALLMIHYAFNLVDDRLLMYYPSYILGLILSNYKPNRTQQIILLAVGLVVTSISAFYVADLTENIHILSLTLPFALPIMFAVSELIAKINILSNILSYLGSVSMCVYLFHRHVYYLLEYFVCKPFTVPFCYLVALPICIVVSIVMNYLIKFVTNRSRKQIKTV